MSVFFPHLDWFEVTVKGVPLASISDNQEAISLRKAGTSHVEISPSISP